MSRVKIEHSDAGAGHRTEQPTSLVGLIQRLDELAAHYEPICGIAYAVDLTREGGRLAVGMSHEGWMLSFFPANDGTPLNSVGDRAAAGSVSFFFGDHTPMSRKYLIPRSLAMQALADWWERGVPSPAVAWTEESFFLD
jgi:hypothetical protein